MKRGAFSANVLAACCGAVLMAVNLLLSVTAIGRGVTVDEAGGVRGSGCAGIGAGVSKWCAVTVCTWPCWWTVCTGCGCTSATPTGGGPSTGFTTTPCGTGGCGIVPTWGGVCTPT